MKRRGQYQYQRQMRAQEDALAGLLEWIADRVDRAARWVWRRVRGR